MKALLPGPWRNLAAGFVYIWSIIFLSTLAYVVLAGWSWGDAFYFVIITVFTVGYGETHPIASPELRAITILTIFFGFTATIFLTGALVQFFTHMEIEQLIGKRRMKTQIAKMTGHVIVCGYGRIGHMLADELRTGGADFVIVDRDETKLAEAAARGLLTYAGDATGEAVLEAVGVRRARALASVVPNDAVNVFVTLSARNMNKDLEIIARGEAANTKSLLLRAGASAVVEPTHIGAERIAQLILFPRTSRFTDDSERMRLLGMGLRTLGLELEVMPVAAGSTFAGATIEAIEREALGGLFVVAVNRRAGQVITRPDPATVIEPGDGVVVITRSGRNAPRAG
jgi:voltage-gated potassium channel Kch